MISNRIATLYFVATCKRLSRPLLLNTDDTEQARCISSTKLEKDHWSHMERQGIKRRSTIARTGQRRLQDIVGERRFRFAGHVMRMAPERQARREIEWTPADGRR